MDGGQCQIQAFGFAHAWDPWLSLLRPRVLSGVLGVGGTWLLCLPSFIFHVYCGSAHPSQALLRVCELPVQLPSQGDGSEVLWEMGWALLWGRQQFFPGGGSGLKCKQGGHDMTMNEGIRCDEMFF